MKLTFNELTMSTGMADIDEQHKELINRINELSEAMVKGRGRDEVGKMVKYVAKYAAWHFGHEELCMERHRCPAAAANKEAHAMLVALFQDLDERIAKEGVTTAIVVQVQRELMSWVSSHIIRTDTQLRACVKKGAPAAV